MATLATKKSCLSETLALLKELVIASHPHKRELLASLCQAACVWVTGNKASSRPGHLLEERRWRWEGNPPASEPRVLIDACFHCRRGTNAALLHAELLLSASLFPWRRTRSVYLGPAAEEKEQPTHLPGKGILNNCSRSEEIGSWAKHFIRGWLKLDSCIHMYVLILKTLTGLLLFSPAFYVVP